jgi:shikimate kinase
MFQYLPTIVFVGLPTVGKTEISNFLASKYNLKVVDTDRIIEQKTGIPASKIIPSIGLDNFRKIEQEVCFKTFTQKPDILSIGGGAWLDESFRNLILSDGISIWLDINVDILMLRESGNRSIFLDDKFKILSMMYRERLTYYQKAHIHVKGISETDSISDVANKVFDLLTSYYLESIHVFH